MTAEDEQRAAYLRDLELEAQAQAAIDGPVTFTEGILILTVLVLLLGWGLVLILAVMKLSAWL